ncbi:MAG: hypothetical protein K9K66_00565 [Desulfarculaceae bacterium]|nr:hypothetical protein [Desulfarculaceae bacterium]MCF8072204.1 hypothetical protein [Desulfarculaceae bacterium]MCF8100125.1 hypothetical protein [Desulfarculaceae bacterium]MCF8117226.1 hypothetical protein [Desulfarculaceae bacterium]
MTQEPLWTRCLHLSGGTCPELARQGRELGGQADSWSEMNQDLALERLGRVCPGCALRPDAEDKA